MPNSTSRPYPRARKLQEAGQKAYRRRDYNAALSDFSQALAFPMSKELRVSILDNRAAVLEKLALAAAAAATVATATSSTSSTSSTSTAATSADTTTEAQSEYYRRALGDARTMVAVLDRSPTGYLRTGKLLQRMRQWDEAVEMYRLGIHNCSDPDAKHMLEEMRSKVLNRLNAHSAVRVDPLGRLPAEIVGMIFGYFPFKDLMLLQGVSRRWRNFIVSYRPGYSTLDFSTAKRQISKSTIDRYLTRANGSTTRAVLNEADGKSLLAVATRCRKLSELRVSSSRVLDPTSLSTAVDRATNLTALFLHCRIPSGLLVYIIKRSEKLQSLHCSEVHQSREFLWDSTETRGLKKLVLRWGARDLATSDFGKMLECLPELRELKLVRTPGRLLQEPTDFSFLRQLEVLTFSHSEAQHPPRVPDSLRHLDVSHNVMMLFDHTVNPLPAGLESLFVADNPSITNRVLLRLLSAAAQRGSLRLLDVSMSLRINLHSFEWLLDAGHGSSLEVLHVAGNTTFGDQVTRELGRMVKLRGLDMALTPISGVGLSNLVFRKGSVLEWVRVAGCHNLGIDAIHAARDQGIQVSYQRSIYMSI